MTSSNLALVSCSDTLDSLREWLNRFEACATAEELPLETVTRVEDNAQMPSLVLSRVNSLDDQLLQHILTVESSEVGKQDVCELQCYEGVVF